jgi:hypothetical protein
LGQQASCFQGFAVRSGHIFRAAAVVQQGVLGTDHRVIETGGNRVRQRDLPTLIL